MFTITQFFKSAGLVTFANIVGRAANVLIVFVIIAIYGANPHTDQFFFLLALAYFFYGTLSYATTESSVPIVIAYQQVLPIRSIFFIGSLCGFAVLVPAYLSYLLGADIPYGYIFGISLMAGAGIGNGLITGILHAGKKYAWPGFSWSLRLIPLAGFALLRQPADNLWLLALGIGLIDWIRFGLLAGRQSRSAFAYQTAEPVSYFKRHYSAYGAMALAMLILGLNPIIDRMIAGLGSPGSISVLDTGERLFGILSTLCTLGMMTVLLTLLSNAAQNRTLQPAWISIVKVVGIWSFAWLIVGLFFGYGVLDQWLSRVGSLSVEQSLTVQKTYWYYLLGLFPHVLSIVYMKRIQATHRTRILVSTSSIAVMLNIPASLILNDVMGVPGIALASSLVHTVCCLLLMMFVHRRHTQT